MGFNEFKELWTVLNQWKVFVMYGSVYSIISCSYGSVYSIISCSYGSVYSIISCSYGSVYSIISCSYAPILASGYLYGCR